MRKAARTRRPFDGKLKRTQMVAALQPEPAQDLIEAAEGSVTWGLQMHPVVGRVAGLNQEMKPAATVFARLAKGVRFPAGVEMPGRLAFA
jgi:hypothetical protein